MTSLEKSLKIQVGDFLSKFANLIIPSHLAQHPIRLSFLTLHQCDQIWRNFDTLSKCNKTLANF